MHGTNLGRNGVKLILAGVRANGYFAVFLTSGYIKAI
jgi:hypothetical protein